MSSSLSPHLNLPSTSTTSIEALINSVKHLANKSNIKSEEESLPSEVTIVSPVIPLHKTSSNYRYINGHSVKLIDISAVRERIRRRLKKGNFNSYIFTNHLNIFSKSIIAQNTHSSNCKKTFTHQTLSVCVCEL